MTPIEAAGARLQRAWLTRGSLAVALLPLALLFGALTGIRRIAYRLGWARVTTLPRPVIVVGNLVAGGAGKTPTVIALIALLRRHGRTPGIVSRGYGRAADAIVHVEPDTAVAECGDEPLLLHRRTGAPVVVGRDRVAASRALLRAHPQIDVIVSDDGLQHLALDRTAQVLVFDERGAGNGWLLPAGPLREPWPRGVDLVLHTGHQPAFDGYRGERDLADEAIGSTGQWIPMADVAASPKPLAAVAGIAQPHAFFDMLQARGLVLATTRALPDHADFDDELSLPDASQLLLCTEKDAAKLWRLRPDALAVPLRFTLGADFTAYFDRLVDARLSSASRAR